ncbi:MAG: outer membrane protein assembly factor BamC [Halieaceae bacterium]
MRLLLLTLLLTLAGCTWLTGEQGYLRDRQDDYRKAEIEPRIKVPANLEDDALQSIYVIPPITEDVQVAGEFSVPRPTPLVARESEEMVRIQRLGEEEWMLAAVAPGQLWPQVRAFLNSTSIQVARVDAREGLIETVWMQGSEETMSERFQFRIEQGVQRNTSEMHVLQMFQTGDIESWPERSADTGRGHDMLMALAQYVASASETAPVSMMAQQGISASGKVALQEDAEGQPYISLELPYHRAWASTERALRESSFTIRDLDRSGGEYFVRFVPPEEDDSGWFDWLLGGDESSGDEIGDQDFILTMVKEDADLVHIRIAREDRKPLEVAQTQQLLTLIKGNIN